MCARLFVCVQGSSLDLALRLKRAHRACTGCSGPGAPPPPGATRERAKGKAHAPPTLRCASESARMVSWFSTSDDASPHSLGAAGCAFVFFCECAGAAGAGRAAARTRACPPPPIHTHKHRRKQDAPPSPVNVVDARAQLPDVAVGAVQQLEAVARCVHLVCWANGRGWEGLCTL